MKKDLLVTLADENYVEQAKQLFSSVYWNAGWKGDYMLLAHEIPEKKLKWFREKGILIKKCKPLYDKKIGFRKRPPTLLSKFYLFTPEFKKWKKVIFLDADIIVRASLDDLTKIEGFAAVLDDLIINKLIDQFIIPSEMDKKVFGKFKKKYNFKAQAFNSGVMTFSTDVIKKDTFSKLKKLFKQYTRLTKPGNLDQPIFNLLFYNQWIKLPVVYNLDVRDFKFINPKKINVIILHFAEENKPWLPNSYFYNEWKFNLDKADKVNLNKIQQCKKFKQFEIENYFSYLKIRSIFYYSNWIRFIDHQIGSIGIFLYDKFPRLYFKLKKLKDRK